MSIPSLLRKGAVMVTKNSSILLASAGVVGFFGTIIVAIKVAPTAKLMVDNLREEYKDMYENGEIGSPEVPKMEIVKKVAPIYLPVALMGGASAACVFGGAKISSSRNAALASLYSGAELYLKDYKNKVIETIGEDKERAIRDKVVQEKIEKHPVTASQVIMTGRGKTLCYDTLIDRYFDHDIEKLRRAELDINARMIYGMEMCTSLNEVYMELGLRPVSIGEYTGFNIDHRLHMDFSSHLSDDDRPCLAVTFNPPPSEDYKV